MHERKVDKHCKLPATILRDEDRQQWESSRCNLHSQNQADASLGRSAVEMMQALTDLPGGNELVRHGLSRMSKTRKSLWPGGRRCFTAELGYANEQRCDAETSIAPARPNQVSRSNGKDPLRTIARLHRGQAA